MPLFIKIALRELRGGIKGFYIALACLILSSFTLTASNSFTASLTAQLQKEGRAILGGDIEVRRIHLAFSGQERAFFQKESREVSFAATMLAMAQTKEHNGSVLLKAVDDAYPLVGEVSLQNGRGEGLDGLLGRKSGVYGVISAPSFLAALNIRVGEIFSIGKARFRLLGVIEKEPDSLADGLPFQPKLIISRQGLAATGLVQLGSLITYRARLVLRSPPPAAARDGFEARAAQAFPRAGWEVRTYRDSSPSLRRFVERVSMFLTLAALTTFLVSGVGIANAVSVWFARRRTTLASLKCLGARENTLVASYLAQILIMASGALIFGISLGALAPFLALPLVQDLLPLAVEPIFSFSVVGIVCVYGLVITLLFSLIPLAYAKATPPSHLFRAAIEPLGLGFLRTLSFRWWGVLGFLVAFLFSVILALSPERSFALYFILGASASIFLLYGMALVLVWFLRWIKHVKNPLWRIALSNITRPASDNRNIIMALGLGLSLLTAIALVEGNLSYQIERGLPNRAPSFFVAGIQQDQKPKLEAFLQNREGIEDIRIVPLLRAPLLSINGKPLSFYKERAAEDIAWVLRGDRGLTYAARPPPNSKLTAGEWWDSGYDGSPLVSLSANVAEGLGLKLGDSVTINLFGVAVKARIHNLRSVDWSQGGMNFVFIFSPRPFNEIPASYFATFRVEEGLIKRTRGELSRNFADIVLVETSEALAVISSLLEQLSLVGRLASFWTLLAGVLVLIASQAASFERKRAESVIFKVLGADRGMILRASGVEYFVLGLSASLVALLIGVVVAWWMVEYLWLAEFIFLPKVALFTIGLALLGSFLCGGGINYRLLGQRPASFLRSASG